MSDWYSQLPSFGWPDFGGQATPSRYATVRYNNPGGMYPGSAARAFGSTGTGVIGGGHLIANFPTPVHGAAANMQNIVSGGYVGMPIGAAISKWSGGGRGTVPGFDSSQRITPEMTRDPNFMVPFMKAVASGEAPGRYPMTDDQWNQAYTWYAQGKSEGPAAPGVATASGGDYPDRTPQERKMPTTSLMDLMQGNAQPQDAMGQPTNWGNALAARSNSLIGLGLGLLQPYNPWAGTNQWSNALKGYMAGAQADESSAQDAWKRNMAERQFAQGQVTDAQKAARDLKLVPGSPDYVKFMQSFYAPKTEDWLQGTWTDPKTETPYPYQVHKRTGEVRWLNLPGVTPPGSQPGPTPPAAAPNAPDAFTRGGGVGYGTGGVGPGGFGTGFGTQPGATAPTTPAPAPAPSEATPTAQTPQQYKTGPKAQELAHNLRKEITALPEVKRISEAMPIYRSMIQSHNVNTRAADLDFVYGVAKIFDPDSVVREGEMKLVGQARTIPEDIQGWMGKVVSGTGTLPPEVRQRILEVAAIRMGQLNEAYKQRMAPYHQVVQQSGLDPGVVLPGMLDMPASSAAPASTANKIPTYNPKTGQFD